LAAGASFGLRAEARGLLARPAYEPVLRPG